MTVQKDKAPVVLFVYNRPEHTLKTLEALHRNEGADETVLYIFADGAKENSNGEALLRIKETREVLRRKNWCKEVYITEREKNYGLAGNITDGVTFVLSKHEKVIVLEDDIITAKSFLDFMNFSLDTYKDEPAAGCISGYIYPVKDLPETFFIRGADCWGWGTWKRVWDHFERDGRILLSELEKENLIRDFDFYNSYPYSVMLRDQIAGKNDSWAVRWYASCFLNRQYCLYPGTSYVENIGLDGSGIHCVTDEQPSASELNTRKVVTKIKVTEHKKAKLKISEYFGYKPSLFLKYRDLVKSRFS